MLQQVGFTCYFTLIWTREGFKKLEKKFTGSRGAHPHYSLILMPWQHDFRFFLLLSTYIELLTEHCCLLPLQVFGYFGLFLFAASALTAYRRLQGSSQFGARKFSTSQTSSSATAWYSRHLYVLYLIMFSLLLFIGFGLFNEAAENEIHLKLLSFEDWFWSHRCYAVPKNDAYICYICCQWFYTQIPSVIWHMNWHQRYPKLTLRKFLLISLCHYTYCQSCMLILKIWCILCI